MITLFVVMFFGIIAIWLIPKNSTEGATSSASDFEIIEESE